MMEKVSKTIVFGTALLQNYDMTSGRLLVICTISHKTAAFI